MSLLDKASLIVTPNAYKESKLYSVVPNTTLGDMDVVRATTATRVNIAGLIEVVPRNLCTYSNDLSNSIWEKPNSTLVYNDIISPDGKTNATKVSSTSTGFVDCVVSGIAGTVYTYSIYIKNNNSTRTTIFTRSSLNASNAYINWSGNVISSITNMIGVLTYDNIGNDWYRIKVTYTSLEVLQKTRIYPSELNSTSSIWVYGAQLEEGTTATEYFPTTTRLNIPRIDYTNGSCPSLLVEPQRTNLILRSEELDNAIWTKSGVTITANAFNSPSGILAADLVTPTILDASLRQSFLAAGAIQYNFSIYLRSATGSSFSTTLRCWRDSPFTNITNSVITVTTEWQRFNFSFTALDSSTHIIAIGASSTLSTGENFYAWGAQLEAGSYPTSYIPTVASSVTRNADVISKTGISSLIGQTEGTIFFDGIVNNIQNGTSNILNTNKNPSTISSIALTKIKATNKIRFEQFLGDGTFVNIPLLSTNSFLNGIRTKVAIRYKSGDFAMYINGNLEATSTSTYTNIGVKSELFLNDSVAIFAFQESVSFNSAQLYKTPLTNLELKSLSTI